MDLGNGRRSIYSEHPRTDVDTHINADRDTDRNSHRNTDRNADTLVQWCGRLLGAGRPWRRRVLV